MSMSLSAAGAAPETMSSWRLALDDAYDCCRAAGLDHSTALELSEAAVVASCASATSANTPDAVSRTRACTQEMLRQRI